MVISTVTLPNPNTPRLVRDIAWAVGSAPLLLPPGDDRFPNSDWFASQLQKLKPALQSLAADPHRCCQLANTISPLRLGGYFEQLILWWLMHGPDYQVLAHNLQVNAVVNGHLQTAGAFDLIVKNNIDNVVEHWELACKFYLQDGPSEHISSWFGPARKDKLEYKYQHLLTKQIALSQTAEGKAVLANKGWAVERHKIIVKGRLFGNTQHLPPEVNRNCLSGWLEYSEHAPSQQAAVSPALIPLQREHWMSDIHANDIDKADANTAHRHGCLCLAEVGKRRNHPYEISRGFIVPADWPQQT